MTTMRALLPALAALLAMPGMAGAQQAGGSRVETVQIEQELRKDAVHGAQGKAYLDTPPAAPDEQPQSQTASEQVGKPDTGGETAQISAAGQRGPAMAQLSQAELEARLAQLSPTERRVLLEAIEGSDICDNPPDVPTIRALCRNRIETRSSEFAERAERPLSAEERLLRGGVDENGRPNVERVIERLSRSSATAEDFDNQAIASIALAPPGAAQMPEDESNPLSNLPSGTEAVINAIINQLGGSAGGP